MPSSFFNDMLQTLTDRSRSLLGLPRGPLSGADLPVLAEQLLSRRGEASGVALARSIIDTLPHGVASRPGATSCMALAERFGPDPVRLARRHRGVPPGARRGDGLRAGHAAEVAAAGADPPPQPRARRHGRARAHARRPARRCWARPGARGGGSPISSICSRPGSTAASWCCGPSTGRPPRTSSRRSSATKPSTRSGTGMTCATGWSRPTGAASPSSTRNSWTSR